LASKNQKIIVAAHLPPSTEVQKRANVENAPREGVAKVARAAKQRLGLHLEGEGEAWRSTLNGAVTARKRAISHRYDSVPSRPSKITLEGPQGAA